MINRPYMSLLSINAKFCEEQKNSPPKKKVVIVIVYIL